jgi:transposase
MALLNTNIWRSVLGVEKSTVIESVEADEDGDYVVAHVRPRRSKKRRCGLCGLKSSLFVSISID